MMKTFDARAAILKYGKPFATFYGKYEILFAPHMLGSMVTVRSKQKDDLCGDYLLADAPIDFVVALGAAAHELLNLRK